MSPQLTPTPRRRLRLPVLVAAALALLGLAGASLAHAKPHRAKPPRATTTAKIVNFERGAPRPTGFPYGAQVVRLDEDGGSENRRVVERGSAVACSHRTPKPRRATTTAKIVTFGRGAPRPTGFPYGAQVVRLDEDGTAIDAKADSIAYFEGSYWLHGEAFGCRYMFFPRPGFCGFCVYQSDDLVHLRSRGTIPAPTTSPFT